MAFNAGFSRITHAYVSTVRHIKNAGVVSLIIFCGVIAGVVFLFRSLPTSLVPDEDQGYSLSSVILDDGASVHRTTDVAKMVTDFALKDKMIEGVTAINGYDMLSGSVKTNYSTVFYSYKPWEERTEKGQDDKSFTSRTMALNGMQPSAVILSFTPPPISGMSTTGGFEGYLQMRGNGSLKDLEASANKLAAAVAKRPEVSMMRNLFSTNSPQIYVNLNRERCKDMGISVTSVFQALQGSFGTYYVNDFNRLGRTFQVRMQADASYRMKQESLNDIYVRNNSGEMVPLSALVTFERRTAPDTVDRYNVFPAAHFMGNPAPGYTTGQALKAVEDTAKEILSSDYSVGWSGSSLQEKLASQDTSTIFILALVMVFLILAAQYESWSLPLAVLTSVPFGVLGALIATYARGLSNDVYFQVALVTLIGLSAKNAILIVEFAVDAWREGLSIPVAALRASRLRFRPIVMTSLAFIFGVLPWPSVPVQVPTAVTPSARLSWAVCFSQPA